MYKPPWFKIFCSKKFPEFFFAIYDVPHPGVLFHICLCLVNVSDAHGRVTELLLDRTIIKVLDLSQMGLSMALNVRISIQMVVGAG